MMPIEEDVPEAIVEFTEEGSDLLDFCAGMCGQKILRFSSEMVEDWGAEIEKGYCLECRASILKE